jgi:hypothetical protein
MSREKDFGDCCYEAWRNGRNPDEIKYDEFDRMYDMRNESPEWHEFYKNYQYYNEYDQLPTT